MRKKAIERVLFFCFTLFWLLCLTACSGRLGETSERAEGGWSEMTSEELEIETKGFLSSDKWEGSTMEDGKLRIPYTVNRSGAYFAVSAKELPVEMEDYGDTYNDDFFSHSALLIVTETVTSGSTKVGIGDIVEQNTVLRVTLHHEAAKTGTSDMATWLLWKEVDKELAGYTVEIVNPALKSDLSVR